MVMEYGKRPNPVFLYWVRETHLSSACQTAAEKWYSSWFLKEPIKIEIETEASSSWLSFPDAPLSLVWISPIPPARGHEARIKLLEPDFLFLVISTQSKASCWATSHLYNRSRLGALEFFFKCFFTLNCWHFQVNEVSTDLFVELVKCTVELNFLYVLYGPLSLHVVGITVQTQK